MAKQIRLSNIEVASAILRSVESPTARLNLFETPPRFLDLSLLPCRGATQDLRSLDQSRLRSESPCSPFRRDQARSKRSRFITLVHAATKSFTNFSLESEQA